MADRSRIEWTDATWNPVTGCTKVSPGCAHCYAEAVVNRFGYSFDLRFFYPHRLTEPDHWRKARRVFVCSMSDLFHPDLPDGFVANVWDVMRRNPRHQFQVLTKRPERTAQLLAKIAPEPLPNVWLGVSVEDQDRADQRIPILLRTPAAKRFASFEPLLGPIVLRKPEVGDWPEHAPTAPLANPDEWDDWKYWAARARGLDWAIVGGESGPKARTMDLRWLTRIVVDCKAAGVPVFVKQDSGRFPGRQGRIPDCMWKLKERPSGAAQALRP